MVSMVMNGVVCERKEWVASHVFRFMLGKYSVDMELK